VFEAAGVNRIQIRSSCEAQERRSPCSLVLMLFLRCCSFHFIFIVIFLHKGFDPSRRSGTSNWTDQLR